MTIKKLIETLKKYDENMNIYGGYWLEDGMGLRQLVSDEYRNPVIEFEAEFDEETNELIEEYLVIG